MKMDSININDINKLLKDLPEDLPTHVVMHPKVWNGWWSVKRFPRWMKIFRTLGRALHSKRLYWLGLPIFWVDGLKDIIDENSYGS